jgi:erythromycin esterase-like protein
MGFVQMFRVRWFALASLLLMTALAPASVSDEQASIQWLRQHAIPIQTVEAGNGFADLQPLRKVVGDARIVELGEATHGTREFFQLKHRMIEFLASQEGFTIFSIEANMPEAYRLNDFVLNGAGDPRQLLKGMYFWTWNTEEVLDMILWMREFNKSGRGRIEFTGFDMQTPTVSMEIVRKLVSSRDHSYLDSTLNPLYDEVSRMTEQQQLGFGVATATLPVQAAAGKHVTISGYIKSEGVADGYAGLWMRVDHARGEAKPFTLDNMSDRGVTGTTSWKRYEISMDVPGNATNINFGALHSGSGTAWFDSLAIEIGGVPYTGNDALDLDFESNTPRGFYTGGQGYEVTLDNTVAQSGKQSLRMKRIAPPQTTASEKDSAASLIQKCSGVMEYLEASRTVYLKAGSASHEIDWVIQNARLVLQYAQLKSGVKSRDESMADNVKWIADQNPGAKLIVWAHNGHIANTGFSGTASMGSYLRKTYGNQLVNFGFAFNEGSFQAFEMGKSLHPFTVAPAPDGSLDRAFAAVGLPVFAVDLRQLPKEGPVAQWFSQPHPSRSIGAAYSDSLAPSLWSTTPANVDFDALLFVEKTTAARPNH